MEIKDSGERREFESGAVRDIQEGKGRCDLLPLDTVALFLDYAESDDRHTRGWNPLVYLHLFDNPESGCADSLHLLFESLLSFADANGWNAPTMLLEVSEHFEDGAKKYGERNWQKGIPLHCYIDSAVRHYLKWRRGDTDEPHDRAFAWNVLCLAWTYWNKPECNDLKREEE